MFYLGRYALVIDIFLEANEGSGDTLRLKSQRGLFVASLLVLLPMLSCQGPDGYYQSAEIDPHTMKTTLSGQSFFGSPSSGGYYWRSGMHQGYALRYIGADGRLDPDMVTMTEESVVATKVSDQVLLQGENGFVFVSTSHHYPPTYQPQAIDFYAHHLFGGTGLTTAKKIGVIDQTASLSAITVVRVFRATTGFFVVSATYAPDGVICTLDVSGS